MRKIKIIFFAIFCVGLFSIVVKPQTSPQLVFDSLKPRTTNLEQIVKIIGKPDKQETINYWMGKVKKDGSFRGYEYERTPCQNEIKNFITRYLYEFDYQKLGIKLTVFDNPWNLYSVSTNNPEINVHNVKVGDNLEKVQNSLGKGKWYSSEASDLWTLDFSKKEVKFYFLRDKTVPQYPMKLIKNPTVVKIEFYDNKTSFVGCPTDDY
jgi:hypothetical protein